MPETEALKCSLAEQDDNYEAPQEDWVLPRRGGVPCGSQRVMCIMFFCVCSLWCALSTCPTPVISAARKQGDGAKCTALAVGWEWCSVDLRLGRTIRRGHPDPSPDPTEYGGATGQWAEESNSLLCRAAGVSISWSCWKVRLCTGLWVILWEHSLTPRTMCGTDCWQNVMFIRLEETVQDQGLPLSVSVISFTGPSAKQTAWHFSQKCYFGPALALGLIWSMLCKLQTWIFSNPQSRVKTGAEIGDSCCVFSVVTLCLYHFGHWEIPWLSLEEVNAESNENQGLRLWK